MHGKVKSYTAHNKGYFTDTWRQTHLNIPTKCIQCKRTFVTDRIKNLDKKKFYHVTGTKEVYACNFATNGDPDTVCDDAWCAPCWNRVNMA